VKWPKAAAQAMHRIVVQSLKGGAIVQHDTLVGTDNAGSEFLEERLRPGHGLPLAVDDHERRRITASDTRNAARFPLTRR